MKTKITLITVCTFLWLSNSLAQIICANDLNGFVNYKNTIAGTSSHQLLIGSEEKAAQTYNYSGPGSITSVRVVGYIPVGTFLAGVPLRIGIYNVDASGKPTTLITSRDHIWWSFPDNFNGLIDVTFPGGVEVNNRFAISVELRSAFPYGNLFNLQYTGNGEGGGQDLASLAGTSTGNNWTSAKNSFNKDGDFYIIPKMAQINSPSFKSNSPCHAINSAISFTNTTRMTKDSMFNKIALANYSGANKFYTWNFGDGSAVSNLMNPTHTYTAGGIYTTTLTTTVEGWSSICTKTYTSSISVGLAANSSSVSNVTCHRGSDGSFTATAQYGAPSYSYNINGGQWQTSPTFASLPAGIFTLNILDSKGCQNSTPVNITQPTGITISLSATSASCGVANGSITTSASGGVSPLTYQLNGGSFLTSGNYSGLIAGTHTLIVKDANGCMTSTLAIINSQTGPNLNTPNVTNVSCFNGNDGSILLTSVGGTGLIQYSINGGGSYQTNGIFTGLPAGKYFTVVKDNLGCTSYQTVIISESPVLTVIAFSDPTLCNGTSNGQITASSIGGIGIRNYSLNGINYQIGSHFSGLAAGIYTVYVKDVNNCIKTQTVAVSQPSPISTTLTSVPVSCFGQENGSITAFASGGNGEYSYSIDPERGFKEVGTFDNLPAGTYTVSVQDLNNCTHSSVIGVTAPPIITSTVNTTNAICGTANGAVQVIAAGGSGSGYQYSIDGTIFNSTGIFSSLNAGTQFVLVKDGSGCSTVVSGLIASAGGPTITTSGSQNISCNNGNDGAITIALVSGGTGSIQYSIDGVVFQTSNVFNSLSAGVYEIQVKDANGCIASATYTLTQPNPFLIAPSTSSITCYGNPSGSATIIASGGAGFLAYSINGGISYQSGTTFTNLYAGNYIVTVKDAANCTASSVFTILQPSSPISVNIGVLNTICFGATNGQLIVNASGGNGPYAYSINGTTYSSVNTFTNLAGNITYTAYVKDANNCITTTTQFISEPSMLNIGSVVNNISCAGGNNGIINLNVTGGSGPYLYQWSNGVSTSSNINLTAGIYSVTIIDYNGCSSQKSYTITQPSMPLIVTGVTTSASSNTSFDGSIDASTTGGSAPYNFNWSNGATTEDLSGLNPGVYMITITDANSCTTSNTFNVGNLTGLEDLKTSVNNVNVFPNPANDFITVEALGYKIDTVELMNLLGQSIILNEVNDSTIKINTSSISNGTYFVKIHIGKNNTITKKININK